MSNRQTTEVRTIHPRALAELGEEACIVALGVARDLRSGVIPPDEFNMGNYCGTSCCVAGHITSRVWRIKSRDEPLYWSETPDERRQWNWYESLSGKSAALRSLFSDENPSDPQLAADAIERYVYEASERAWESIK